MKKRIIVFISVVFCFFAFLVNVKALNKIYFDSEDLSVMPGETKEVGVYVDSDSSFTSIKMNVITTSNSINFAGITYNEAFTKTNNGSSVILTSKTPLKSGSKVATINVKAIDSATVGTTGYIRVSNVSLNDVQLENASLNVKVSNESSSSSYLKSVTSNIVKIDFNKDTYDYEYEVSNDVDKMDLVAQAEDSNAKIDISNQTLKIGENTIKITVTAKNKDKKVYTFSINRKEKENQIDEKDDDVIPISDSVETKKPNKTGFVLLLGILIGVMIIDLVIMKKNKYTRRELLFIMKRLICIECSCLGVENIKNRSISIS